MRIGCDVGGTFTDLVAVDPETGRLRVGKALNSGHGPAQGLLGALDSAGVAPAAVSELTHGTTVVTNLLIERTGDPVGLICSTGFRDVLEIQLSFRERTFDGRYRKVPAIVPRHLRLEIAGRILPDGNEAEPLDLDEVRDRMRALHAAGVRSLAVSLYNAYANPAQERAVAELWRSEYPELPITCATDVDPRLGEYERVSTATLNATAVPRMRAYVTEMEETLPTPTLYMHSAGGVLPARDASDRPILLAFSGPAAGVLAAQRVMRDLGLSDAITLDMGGTSCDVCLIQDGRVREREQFDVAWGVPARVRSMDIGTVGAGGGSIASRDSGGALVVGPRSAGALPGPACYGRGGGEATVTDANLVLGILPERGLLAGSLPLDAEAAEAALGKLGDGFGVSAVEAAAAVHRLVSASMAAAVRQITVRHGIDPRRGALIAFGGAGPQHATAVAAELGMTRIVVPAHSSVLSAVGLLTADVRTTAARTLMCSVDELGTPAVEAVFAELELEASLRLGDGIDASGIVAERWVGMRYAEQWHEVALPLVGRPELLVERFEAEHERRFGTRLGIDVEIVDAWVTTVVPRSVFEPQADAPGTAAPEPARRRWLHLDRAEVPVYDRDSLGTEKAIGPCLVEESTTVTVVEAGSAVFIRRGHLVLERDA